MFTCLINPPSITTFLLLPLSPYMLPLPHSYSHSHAGSHWWVGALLILPMLWWPALSHLLQGHAPHLVWMLVPWATYSSTRCSLNLHLSSESSAHTASGWTDLLTVLGLWTPNKLPLHVDKLLTELGKLPSHLHCQTGNKSKEQRPPSQPTCYLRGYSRRGRVLMSSSACHKGIVVLTFLLPSVLKTLIFY